MLLMIALAAATSAVAAPGALAVRLYDGTYATDLATSVPSSLSPESGVTLNYPTSNIRLSWTQVPGATQYQLQIARQNGSSADCAATTAFQLDNVVLTTTTTQTNWVPTLATEPEGSAIWTGTYCWRVRTTGEGPGTWSAAHRFTREWASLPTGLKFFNDHDGPIPRTSANADWATGSTATKNSGYLTWDVVPGASKYEVQVSPSRTFSESSMMVQREGVSDNKVVLLHLPDDTYFWRVRGVSPNGTEGAWSTTGTTFTVKWQDTTWSEQARIYPSDSSTQSDLRIGWTSMPGASHYEYQIGTNAGCFWDPIAPTIAPRPYGDWVNKPAVYNELDSNILEYTQPPLNSQCRVSELDATTINNWVTLQEAMSSEVLANITKRCVDQSGKVICEPAGFPDSIPDSWGSQYEGVHPVLGPGGDDGEAYQIHWRVRPVYMLTQASETGWKVTGTDGIKVYGAWSKYRQSGANREYKFAIDTSAAAVPHGATATRCENPGVNPLVNQCLAHIGSSMSATDPIGAGNSTTMQMPVLTWRPFAGAGGYVVQIARDPLFNNMVSSEIVPAQRVQGFDFQQSYALKDGLPDNAEGTGYWWRVTPCVSGFDDLVARTLTICAPFYSDDAGGLPTSADPDYGYADDAVARSFTKRTEIQTRIAERFEGATPLISWTSAGVGSDDHAGWSAGIPGAHHYEMQLARDPFMTKELVTLTTTIPRIAPFKPSEDEGAGSTVELDDGIWYYRVRPVDRNDVLGTWSNTGSFNKRVEAPGSKASGGNAAGPGVVVAWDPVQGATSYEIEWSPDSGFENGIRTGSTLQSMFRIPDTELGTFYWRVRAVRNHIKGQWSLQSRYVAIVPATKLRYGLNRDVTFATEKVTVTGELKIAGTPRNGKVVRLQRKASGCDAKSGRYVDVGRAVTGRNADDGLVSFPTKVTQNTCMRLAWVSGGNVHYSAPIPVKVSPRLLVGLDRKVVRRGKNFCIRMRSNIALNGNLRVQYRTGTGAWTTSRSARLVRAKVKRQCASIPKAGRFQVRIIVDKLKHPRGRWQQFQDVIVAAGTVRVNDVWTVHRGR